MRLTALRFPITSNTVLSPAHSSLIVILGPTGSGKSALALTLAEHFNGEIINCDSVQVYRGLDIGSAKTPPDQRRRIPHHLLDIAAPEADLTAGAYAQLARNALAQLSARQALPIVVGGTGFYLRSLLDGLSPAPGRDPALRQRLYKVAVRRPSALHRLLTRRDPPAANRIHPNDHQKLIRAIEISADPAPLSPRQPLTGYSVLKIGLNPPRPELHQRLNQRTIAMFRDGILAETQALLAAGLPATAKSLQSLGYKQALRVLTHQLSLEQGIEDCQTKTRQYAKRQLTWFRREADVHWLNGFGDELAIQARATDLLMSSIEYPSA
jgi:tRNA dimethylallyltransferase